jgi:D-aminopeptidase
VLVQCNYGTRLEFRVAGVPVGREIADLLPCISLADSTVRPGARRCAAGAPGGDDDSSAEAGAGSIIIVIATDAPVLPHQLKRIATRASLAVGRMGGHGESSSGDIFIAFSTANPRASRATSAVGVTMLPNQRINPLFYATVQATEEAILNAMLAAETMTGADGTRAYALPVERLRAAMAKYGRPVRYHPCSPQLAPSQLFHSRDIATEPTSRLGRSILNAQADYQRPKSSSRAASRSSRFASLW